MKPNNRRNQSNDDIFIVLFLAEDKVKDRLAIIAREKLGILSKEKQLQLERKKRAMAFLNQIGGPPADTTENDKPTENSEKPNGSGDSDDSVTFVSITPSTSVSVAAAHTVRRQRNIRSKRNSRDNGSDSDDVVEIVSKRSRSRSR